MLSLLFVLGVVCSPTAFAAATASGNFNVLSLNVAGLPEILNGNGEGDKTTNTMLIGEALSTNKYVQVDVCTYLALLTL